MKKKVLSCFMAVFMLLSVGCGDSSSSQGGDYTQKVEYENVTLYLPDDAEEKSKLAELCPDKEDKEYKTSFGEIRIYPDANYYDRYSNYGCDLHNDKLIDEEVKNKEDVSNTKKIKIGEEKAFYYEYTISSSWDNKKGCHAVKLVLCSINEVINICIISDESIEKAREEYEEFTKHITIDTSKVTIEYKGYSAFKSAISQTKAENDFVYYKLTDLSSSESKSDTEKKFIENLKWNRIDKGFIYGYYVELNGSVEKEGICYAESKDSTDLKFYPKEFEDKWKKDGRKFSEFCEAIDAAAAVAKALAEEKAEKVRLTGTSDVALQEVILSKPTVFYKEGPADAFGQKETTYILAYDLKNGLEKSKAQSWTEGRACTGQLGLCLAKEYTDGHWEKSDDSGYDYMYKSDSFRRIYGDYLYVSLYGTASGGYYTNIAFSSHVPMINFLEDLKLI